MPLFYLAMILVGTPIAFAAYRKIRPTFPEGSIGTVASAGASATTGVAVILIGGLAASLFHEAPLTGLVLLLAVGLAMFAWAWVREFVHLMGVADDSFPGRHDKVLWVVLMVLLPPIGVAAFSIFRRVYWAAEKPEGRAAAHDLL